ncbi:MAG TPA: hypothetical protein VLT90_06605 [Terriglobales bacterium]|nr:hypothetical protein [Terriglobales bacterium]
MFSTFPDGWSGAGLLLLRAVLGCALTISGVAYLRAWRSVGSLGIAIVSILIGVLLIFGYRTRIFAVIASVIFIASSFFPPNYAFADSRATAVFCCVIAIALACLGPGAFAVDAKLFGRREIVIPKFSRKANSD